MSKSIRIVIYIIYISVIIFAAIMGERFNEYLFLLYSTCFKPSYFWFLPVYPILIGCLIALPEFISKALKAGVWRFDWLRFLIVGIPSLYIAFTYVIYFGQRGNFLPFIYLLIYSRQFYIISGIIFGYTLLASFNKYE